MNNYHIAAIVSTDDCVGVEVGQAPETAGHFMSPRVGHVVGFEISGSRNGIVINRLSKVVANQPLSVWRHGY